MVKEGMVETVVMGMPENRIYTIILFTITKPSRVMVALAAAVAALVLAVVFLVAEVMVAMVLVVMDTMVIPVKQTEEMEVMAEQIHPLEMVVEQPVLEHQG